MPSKLEDLNVVPVDGEQVVVHGQEGQEGHEDCGGGGEVPQVVVVVELQVGAVVRVETARLRGALVAVGVAVQIKVAGHHAQDQS